MASFRLLLRKPHFERDPMHGDCALRQFDYLGDCLIQIKTILSRRRFLGVSPDTVDDVAGSISVAHDTPERFSDFAQIWRAAEKIVYSRTLQTVSSARTRIERDLDPDAVRQLKETSEADITIGGAELAGHAIGAGLVDECHLFLCPIVVGGGKRALPEDVRAQLELLDERRFRNDVVHLHYRISA